VALHDDERATEAAQELENLVAMEVGRVNVSASVSGSVSSPHPIESWSCFVEWPLGSSGHVALAWFASR
jgi:hypothetical protein